MCALADGLLIPLPVLRRVPAHLPSDLIPHIDGRPPNLRATRATLLADRGPLRAMVGLPRLQGQRAAGTVRAEGVDNDPFEELAHRGWSGLGRYHSRPYGDRKLRPLERPDDNRVRKGLPVMGGPPRQDTPVDRPEGVEHLMAEAKSFAAFCVPSGSVEGDYAGSRCPLRPLNKAQIGAPVVSEPHTSIRAVSGGSQLHAPAASAPLRYGSSQWHTVA